jgi:hypothetical protein
MKKSKFVTIALWAFLVILALATIEDIAQAVNLIQSDSSFRNLFHYLRLPVKDLIIIFFILRELHVRGELFATQTVKEEIW